MNIRKKLLPLLVGFVVGCLIVGLFIAYRMGAFNKVRLLREQRGPYRIVCLPHTGAYNRIGEKILKVKALLKRPDDQLGLPCGIYYDNPNEVAEEKLRSKGGYVIKGEVKTEAPLEVENIPRREALVARFKGHPVVAAMKICPAMSKWMSENGRKPAGPAIEFYRKGLVEREMPVVASEE